jgi:FkbM family methyltransferase
MRSDSFSGRLMKGIGGRFATLLHNPYAEVNLNWFKVKYYKHKPPGGHYVHRMFGKEFHFNSPAEFLHALDEIFVHKLYHQDLSGTPYIIDCGANIGLSVIYMKLQCPDAHILAFEPDESNFELLSKNIESFGFKNVELRKEAVWKENTTLQFSNEGSMSSRIMEKGASTSREVRAIRLRDALDRPIDFLKIDIEGAEFEVLKDIDGEMGGVRNLFIEYHGNFDQNGELAALFDLLCRNGFHFYIKEATEVYRTPFDRDKPAHIPYDIQLNIFCFNKNS